MPGVALWCQPLAISIGVRSVENFLSYAGKPASELACWTARDSAVLVIGAKIKEESQKCRFNIREGIFFSLPHYPAWRLRREKPGHR
jgi:hypothetical protein